MSCIMGSSLTRRDMSVIRVNTLGTWTERGFDNLIIAEDESRRNK